jgi:long-chain fatty acid transport protein
MRKNISWISVTLLLFSASIAFGNGLSLNSIGARALGMGGAYVGLANDYTAIFWNPAGLKQVQAPQLGVFFTSVIPSGTYEFATYGIDAETKSNLYPCPGLMGYLPLFGGEKITAGLGAYVHAGLGAEWDGADLVAFDGPAQLMPGVTNPFAGKTYEWLSKIGVFNIAPGIAYQVSDKISVGAAVNIFYGMMDMKRAVDALNITANPASPAPGEDGMVDNQYEESGSGLGFGFSLGLLVKPVDILSIGLSVKTKNTVKFEGTAKNTAFEAFNAYESDYERDLAWPLWVGAGIALTPVEKLTITADVQFSQWSDTQEKIITEYKNAVWAGAMDEEARTMEMNWEDKTQLRFGAQYQLTEMFALRAGYYYDPAPAPDETANIIFPSITYNAIAFGASYCFGKVNLDFGFEYLFGEDREIAPSDKGNMPGVHGMNIIAPSLGVSYSF